jgi:hypothetical protein
MNLRRDSCGFCEGVEGGVPKAGHSGESGHFSFNGATGAGAGAGAAAAESINRGPCASLPRPSSLVPSRLAARAVQHNSSSTEAE